MSRILIYAVYVMAVLSMIVQMNDGITIELEWSAEGLESYTDPR